MPFIKVQTSAIVTADKQPIILKQLSKQLASHLGKSETYVMTAMEGAVAMTFGGTSEPACYIEVKSIGTLTPEQTSVMSQAFCELIEQTLDVPRSRTYIEFSNAIGPMWGWNGTTFAL